MRNNFSSLLNLLASTSTSSSSSCLCTTALMRALVNVSIWNWFREAVPQYISRKLSTHIMFGLLVPKKKKTLRRVVLGISNPISCFHISAVNWQAVSTSCAAFSSALNCHFNGPLKVSFFI